MIIAADLLSHVLRTLGRLVLPCHFPYRFGQAGGTAQRPTGLGRCGPWPWRPQHVADQPPSKLGSPPGPRTRVSKHKETPRASECTATKAFSGEKMIPDHTPYLEGPFGRLSQELQDHKQHVEGSL